MMEKKTRGAERERSGMHPFRDTASLYELIVSLEMNAHLSDFGVVGVRPWSSYQDEAGLPPFLKTFVHSGMFINVEKTKDVFFATNVYFGEDIDVQLNLIKQKIPFSRFDYLTKQLQTMPC